MKYELTLTLKPQLYQHPPQEQYRLAHHYLQDILQLYEVSLVAELTQDHNIHFHGIIELDSIQSKDKFLNKFRGCRSKFFGRKTCSQLLFEESYIKYMRKDLEKTRVIISDPIVRDSFGVFKILFNESGVAPLT